MIDFFAYHRLADLLETLKPRVKLVDIAKVVVCTHQKITLVFQDKPHWVYPEVRKWRKALRLSRLEGDYFELLAILATYPQSTEAKKEAMIARAFHLAGRQESLVNPTGSVADSLIYWLDPLFSIMRNMTEMAGFPEDEERIIGWAATRLRYVGSLSKLKKEIPGRLEAVWRWLRQAGAVRFDEELGRWSKSEPAILSKGKVGPSIKDIQSAILVLVQVNAHREFIHEVGSPEMLGAKNGLLTIPSDSLELFDQLQRDFLHGELLRKFAFLVNLEDRERLKTQDPDYYREITEYERVLQAKGYTIPRCDDKDVDTMVQVLLIARKVAQ